MRRVAAVLVVIGLGLPGAASVVDAQPKAHVPRVGLLSDESASGAAARVSLGALTGQLRDLGWTEGQNFGFERRYAGGDEAILPGLAAELVGLKMDVIVTFRSPATSAARKVTATIPIVFARVADPVGAGFVGALSRPGGNLTGVTVISTELAAKRLELLTEAVPSARRVGVLWDRSFPPAAVELRRIVSAARSLGTDVVPHGIQRPDELDGAFSR